jgi:hypothetical protein
MSDAKDLTALPCPFCGAEARTYQYNGTLQATCPKEYDECAGSDVAAPVAMWNRRFIAKRKAELRPLVIGDPT